MTEYTDQERRLKYQLKRANVTMGQQGQTIHTLRAELAEVRALNSKIERGELRRLERQVEDAREQLRQAHDSIASLRHRLMDRIRVPRNGQAPEVQPEGTVPPLTLRT